MAFAAPLAEGAAAEGAAAGAGGGAARAGTLRPNAYTGPSAMATDRRNHPARKSGTSSTRPRRSTAPAPSPGGGDETPAPQGASPDEDQSAGSASTDRSRSRTRSATDSAKSAASRGWGQTRRPVVREGSWVFLGFLGWVWVGLPFIKKGPAGVKEVLLAKFVNRTPTGK